MGWWWWVGRQGRHLHGGRGGGDANADGPDGDGHGGDGEGACGAGGGDAAGGALSGAGGAAVGAGYEGERMQRKRRQGVVMREGPAEQC